MSGDWYLQNQRYLMAAVAIVRDLLEASVRKDGEAAARVADLEAARAEARAPADEMASPPAVEALCETLGLSSFDRDTLLLCAAMELDGGFAALCAEAQGDDERAYPTFGLALATLPEADWAALSPGSPLRRWQLLELGPGNAVTSSPLRIDEPILHFLTGVRSPDERLAGVSLPVEPAGDLVPSHQELVEELAEVWRVTAGTSGFPVLQLSGGEVAGKLEIAAALCRSLDLGLWRAPAAALPTTPADLDRLTRLWSRSALLDATALLLDCEESEPGDAARDSAIRLVLEGYKGPMLLTSRKRRAFRERPVLSTDVEKPRRAEQRRVWEALIGEDASELEGALDRLTSQFDLSVPAIRAAWARTLGAAKTAETALEVTLWDSCRNEARPRLDDLAKRIRTVATWEQLVLPEDRRRLLRAIAAQVRRRSVVHERWGFSERSSRGLGVAVLFAGASGTGKTMAAEVLARDLDLDLYRIDLSSVVSKYIGETEKNLSRVFDAAEEGGAILLFDEADALFGKRSEVRDSHDRYANVEISYLLQRMESYRGLAILTTNMKDALDQAFLRRLRFVVDFPFPDRAERAAIWASVFPPDLPTETLDVDKLARLGLAGGSIRNIALGAAFLAAEEEAKLSMRHLRASARIEFDKIQKPLAEREVSDWA